MDRVNKPERRKKSRKKLANTPLFSRKVQCDGLDWETRSAPYMKPSSSKIQQKRRKRSTEDEDDVEATAMKDAPRRSKRGLDRETRSAPYMKPSSSKIQRKRRRRSTEDEDDVEATAMKDAPRRSKRAKKSVVSYVLHEVFNSDEELSPQKTVTHTAHEEDLSGDDECLYCEECGYINKVAACPVHGSLTPLDETQGKDKKSAKYTSVFVPKQLTVRESSIPNAGLGVFASKRIPNRVQCGPYMGKMLDVKDFQDDMDPAYMWEIKEGHEVAFIVDGKDLSTANWMRYINCASNDVEQNMEAFQCRGNVFYRTSRPIQPGEELLVWYGDAYAKELGIDVQLPLGNESSSGREEEEVPSRNGFSIAYKCLGCGDGFVEHRSFKIHLKNNTGCNLANPQRFTCRKCGLTFGRLFQLQFHVRQHLETPPVEQGKGTAESPDNHTDDKQYKCTYCDYCCSQSGDLKRHLSTHTAGDKPYKCTYCDYCSSRTGNLKTHLKTHTGEKPYKCTYCDYCCRRSDQLKSHLSTHTGDKPYKCTYCDFCCSHSGHLKAHLSTHTGDKLYKCTYCDYCCSQSGTLKAHLRTHTGDKPYKCTYCDYCSSHSGHLKSHLSTHTGDKPYKCTYCDYCSSHSGHLKRHLSTHTGDKPYKCTYCDYCSSQSGTLNIHLRTHTGDKPYKCTSCDYCSSQSGDLKRHLSTHTDDKPYKCTYCEYCSSQSGNLKRHLSTHTGDKP